MTMTEVERLARANPVPRASRPEIAARLHLETLKPSVRKPPTKRRRAALAFSALGLLAVAALLVAPALGFGIPGIDFFSSDKAPASVVKDFATLSTGAPAGLDPGVIANETRTVTTVLTRSGRHTLWVAPTRMGGFCYGWSKSAGGCDAHGVFPLAVTWSAPNGFVSPGERDFPIVEGHVHSPWADGVQIHLSDGSTVEPGVTWVSAPIDAGFFYYEAPEGLSVRNVVATKKGEAVDSDETGSGRLPSGSPSPFALLDEKKPLDVLETTAGRATIWVAPTKTNKVCRWLELGGEKRSIAPCLPDIYGIQGLPVSYETIDGVRLFFGAAGPHYGSVALTLSDGQTVNLRPTNGVFLYEIKRPVTHIVVDAKGEDGQILLPRLDLELKAR